MLVKNYENPVFKLFLYAYVVVGAARDQYHYISRIPHRDKVIWLVAIIRIQFLLIEKNIFEGK